MEWFLSLFISHDAYVLSFLVLAIGVLVVALMMTNHKSPETVIDQEFGRSEPLEAALRRVLREGKLVSAAPEESVSGLVQLREEVLAKDRTIAELNKQLNQKGSGGAGASAADQAALQKRIADLEAQLEEYQIIEDDIADLSSFRTENQKLKDEIARLKGKLTSDEVEGESSDQEPAVDSGEDLVSEFEKVVQQQEVLADTEAELPMEADEEEPVHPKLAEVSPNSKEEADVFISELKSLKRG